MEKAGSMGRMGGEWVVPGRVKSGLCLGESRLFGFRCVKLEVLRGILGKMACD